jgi:hypothetical protein
MCHKWLVQKNGLHVCDYERIPQSTETVTKGVFGKQHIIPLIYFHLFKKQSTSKLGVSVG